MTRIGIRELRQHASRYVSLVRKGETVEVTDRGELVALLSPPDAPRSAREQLIAAGLILPATSPTGRLRSPHPVPVAADEPTNLELLDVGREERL